MYGEKYNEEIYGQLPVLFVNGPDAEKIRVRYWETITELLINSFYKPINDWCEENNKLLTAHLKGEENPFFQLSYSGSMFQVLKSVNLPAIDALERFPGNNFYPRAVHSISVQNGCTSTLVEAMGGAGWGVTPETFTNYILWLAGHGLKIFVMHLNQYKLNMHALHDWSSSIPCHVSWKEAFPSIIQDIKEKASRLHDVRNNEPELLVVTPTRGVMAHFKPSEAMTFNEHDGSHIPNDIVSGRISNQFIELIESIHETGIHYELTEEAVLENALIKDGNIQIGKRKYRKIFIPSCCVWDNKKSLDIELKLKEHNIKVVTEEDILINKEETELLKESEKIWIEQSEWLVKGSKNNTLLLNLKESEEGLYSEFKVKELPKENIAIRFLDPVQKVFLNNQELVRTLHRDHTFEIKNIMLKENNSLSIVTTGATEIRSIAFIEGHFAVKSNSVYKDFDNRQLVTEGPFFIDQNLDFQPEALVQSGFPFYSGDIVLEKEFRIEEMFTQMQVGIDSIQADAAFITIDDTEIGWVWGPNWEISLPNNISRGEHKLKLTLIPSTYNTYGPHFHYEGDRHLVSPAQYQGIKNFADHESAPENTFTDQWHLVKTGVGQVYIKP